MFEFESEELELDDAAGLLGHDVDALAFGRIRRRIVGRVQAALRRAERAAAQRFVDSPEAGVRHRVVGAEAHPQLVAQRRERRRKRRRRCRSAATAPRRLAPLARTVAADERPVGRVALTNLKKTSTIPRIQCLDRRRPFHSSTGSKWKGSSLQRNISMAHLDVVELAVVGHLQVEGQEGEADALVGQGADQPLAIEVVLVHVRMVGRLERAARRRQQAAAARHAVHHRVPASHHGSPQLPPIQISLISSYARPNYSSVGSITSALVRFP